MAAVGYYSHNNVVRYADMHKNMEMFLQKEKHEKLERNE